MDPADLTADKQNGVRQAVATDLVPRARVPRCAWCGARVQPAGRRLVGCGRCGAATTYPPPDEAELEAAYGGWYRPAGGRFAGGGDRFLRRSRATLAGRIDRRAPAGAVLDVGSGDGVLLDALHERGREAIGLERSSPRPDVRACELAQFDERIGEWAAVILWHSLEHLRDAAAGLERACELLAPGGLLIVAVPNRDSWQSRCFGDRWLGLDLPRHLVHLPSRALLERVGEQGMRIERVSHWRGGQVVFGWLHGLVGALPSHPDLYAAIRRPQARSTHASGARRAATLAIATILLPAAIALAGAEVAARAGGVVCVEARRV
jgi:SAM-dependent methyltransferase